MIDEHSQKLIHGSSDLDDQKEQLVDHDNKMAEEKGNCLSSIANDLTTFEIDDIKLALSLLR